VSAPTGTVTELAKAWHAEIESTAGTEGIGDGLALDRALIETPATSREDAIALLGVAIRDFQIHNKDAAGKMSFEDNGQEILWTAINVAHRLLTA
jgi:hypothetical protein